MNEVPESTSSASVSVCGRERVVILGAGNLGQQMVGLAEAIEAETSQYRLIGFLDPGVTETEVWGIPVLGDDSLLPSLTASYVLGVGLPSLRRKLDTLAHEAGRAPASLIHPDARIGKYASVGPGAVMFETSQVLAGASVGRHGTMAINTFVAHHAEVGDYVVMAGSSSVGARAHVGDEVILGIGSIILGDVTVGDRAVVGAGAVVTKDVKPDTCVVGVPARETEVRRGRITA